MAKAKRKASRAAKAKRKSAPAKRAVAPRPAPAVAIQAFSMRPPKPTDPPLEPGEKPKLGLPDPLEAAQEAARLAQEGSLKLSRSVDALRIALETIVMAEVDNQTHMPVTTRDLRGIATSGLNAYSQISGQSWKRHKLVGSWAGGTGNAPVHERDM